MVQQASATGHSHNTKLSRMHFFLGEDSDKKLMQCSGRLDYALVQCLPKLVRRRLRTKSRRARSSRPTTKKLGLDTLDTSDGDAALQLVGARATAHFSEEYNRKLRRKLDLVIPTISAAVYSCQYFVRHIMDKTSLNYARRVLFAARLGNMNIDNVAVSWASRSTTTWYPWPSTWISRTVQTTGYLFWEFPTVYISQKLRLAKYLGGNIVVWGIILMFACLNKQLRSLLCSQIPSGRMNSHKAQRISWFYVMNGLTQVFGGFVAY
ncbi:hypothetical protein DFJ58DRAFT_919304, partial [Suillus subalutaceus]|uniref:uncharacterized protein n=1 Tax=Suillus subalutaceus TaxID=48586 RepID=UPI001B8728BB